MGATTTAGTSFCVRARVCVWVSAVVVYGSFIDFYAPRGINDRFYNDFDDGATSLYPRVKYKFTLVKIWLTDWL